MTHTVARPATAPPGDDDRPAWTTGKLVLLLALAVAGGLAAALAPGPTLVVALVGLVGVLLLAKAEWAVVLVVMAAPFEDYLRVVHPDAVKLFAAALFVSWLARRLLRPDGGSLRHPVVGAAMGFLLALLVATAVAPNDPLGLEVASRYLGFLAILVVMVDLFRRDLAVASVARAYVVACTGAAVAGIASFFTGPEGRVGGPLEDPNDLAFFLLVAVAFAVGLRRVASRRSGYDLALVLLLLALAGTLSRGALIGLVLMVVFALLWGQVRPAAVAALVLVSAVGLGAVAVTFPEQVDESLSDKASIADQNVDDRLGLWRIAGEMVLRNPVVGLGPGGFASHFEEYAEETPVAVSHDLSVAHNMFLEIGADLGLLGLGAFVTLLGTGLAAALRRWRADQDPLAAATACALVGTSGAAMFLSEQYFLPVWLLVACAAGLWPRREAEEEAVT